MAATAHGNGEVMRAGKVDGVEHIGHPGAPRDEGGMLVDHPIPHLAGLLIRRVLGTHQRPVQTRFEGGHGCRIQLDIGPSQGGSAQRTHRLSFLRGHNRGLPGVYYKMGRPEHLTKNMWSAPWHKSSVLMQGVTVRMAP
jgi:hypothetical protein